MRRVTADPAAALAFAAARRWLLQPGSGPTAGAKWEALKQARRDLKTYPYIGSPSPEHPGHRQRVVAEHRIIYRVDPDTGDSATAGDIRIVAVFGPGQP
jgi:plasmid stabilization system protein ParE